MDNKVYQPIVIEKVNIIIDSLDESDFFNENDIKDKTFAFNIICEKLTEKFILGELENGDGIFNEDEFHQLLSEIVATHHLENLKKKGLVNSIENEYGEEVFFLTDLGKDEAKKITNE